MAERLARTSGVAGEAADGEVAEEQQEQQGGAW